jgi:hypothetical protein
MDALLISLQHTTSCQKLSGLTTSLIQNTSGVQILFDVHDANYVLTKQYSVIGKLAQIGPLQNNGGHTQTDALLRGSPAIDAVPLPMCHINGITTDQRGMRRPDDKEIACDIGAYEY